MQFPLRQWIGQARDRLAGHSWASVTGVAGGFGGMGGLLVGASIGDWPATSAAATGTLLWLVCRAVSGPNPTAVSGDESAGRHHVFSDRIPALPPLFVGRNALVARLVGAVERRRVSVLTQSIQGLESGRPAWPQLWLRLIETLSMSSGGFEQKNPPYSWET